MPTSDTLRYNVPGAKKADALAHSSLAAVLASEHPDFPGYGMWPQSAVAVERIGAGTDIGWIVEVEYALNRLTGSGVQVVPPDTTDQLYKLESVSTRIEEITIPVVHVQRAYLPILGSILPPVLTNFSVQRLDVKQVLPMTQYQVRLNVEKSTFDAASVATIAGETGKIHTFGGLQWLFQGGSSDELESGVVSIVYTWMNDPGTPAIASLVNDNINLYRIAPDRLPFQEYVVRTFTTASGPDAEILCVNTYEANPTGHTTLPGSPI